MLVEFLSPYSACLKNITDSFSQRRGKVSDHTQMTLLAAMDAAADGITADSA